MTTVTASTKSWGIGTSLAALVPGFALTAYKGWVLSVMWGWFIVPALDVPRLGVIPAIGISLLVSLLMADFSRPRSDINPWAVQFSRLMFYSMAIGFGWIVHLFM